MKMFGLDNFRFWYNTSTIRDFIWWFKHLLVPWHRYHVLRLHSPGYADPRHQMICAVMGVVERYVDELRVNSPKNLSRLPDSSVVDVYLKDCERFIDNPNLDSWDLEYEDARYRDLIKLKTIVDWWERVKDSSELDCWSEEDCLSEEDPNDDLTIEAINHMLKQAIDLRPNMRMRRKTWWN